MTEETKAAGKSAEAVAAVPSPDVESSSEGYARRFLGPTGSWFLDVQLKGTLGMLAPWPGATVLDVGGGHGQLAGPLAERGYRVAVLGSDGSCADRIRPLVDAGRVSFKVGDLLTLPYPDRSFDAVLAFRLIAHIPRWQRLIAEMARVARRAVIFDFAATRSLNFLTPLLFRYKLKVEGNTRPYALFSESELAAEFKAHGFAKDGRFAQFFWPMAIHRALGMKNLSVLLEAPCRLTGLTALLGSPVILKMVREERAD